MEHGRGAWRWWRRNAALAWRKRLSRRAEFLYREPLLEGVRGGDADAVYYAAPLDLLCHLVGKHDGAVASAAFGLVKRNIGVTHQFVGGNAVVRRDGDAD